MCVPVSGCVVVPVQGWPEKRRLAARNYCYYEEDHLMHLQH